MKRSIELRNEIVDCKSEMQRLKENNKINEAYALIEKINNLKQELAIAESIEENVAGISNHISISSKHDVVSAFNKAIRGKELSDIEMALVEKTGEDGGYLVPEIVRTEIDELKRSLNPLKNLCHIIPVTTNSGQNTVEVENDGKLLDFDEMGEISEGDARFKRVKWQVKDKGLLMPVSNQLLADEKANLMAYITKDFAKRATRSENADIIAVLKTAEIIEAINYDGINTAINIELDSAIADNAVIITNQTGYDYLDRLKDSTGRPLLTPDLTNPTTLLYRGHRIIKVNDSEYAAESGKIEFWVGDIGSFVDFMDRQGYEVAVSSEAGFKTYSTIMRCVERYAVTARDAEAGVRVVIPVSDTQSVAGE